VLQNPHKKVIAEMDDVDVDDAYFGLGTAPDDVSSDSDSDSDSEFEKRHHSRRNGAKRGGNGRNGPKTGSAAAISRPLSFVAPGNDANMRDSDEFASGFDEKLRAAREKNQKSKQNARRAVPKAQSRARAAAKTRRKPAVSAASQPSSANGGGKKNFSFFSGASSAGDNSAEVPQWAKSRRGNRQRGSSGRSIGGVSAGGAGNVLKMMAKMGWTPGSGGLGADGSGMTQHVEVKMRPGKAMGMGFGEFDEATEQQKALAAVVDRQEREARIARGEAVSSSSESSLSGDDADDGLDAAPRWQRQATPKPRHRVRGLSRRPSSSSGSEDDGTMPSFATKVVDLTGPSSSSSSGANVGDLLLEQRRRERELLRQREKSVFLPGLQSLVNDRCDALVARQESLSRELEHLQHSRGILERTAAAAESNERIALRHLSAAQELEGLLTQAAQGVLCDDGPSRWNLEQVAAVFALIQQRDNLASLASETQAHMAVSDIALSARLGESEVTLREALRDWNPLGGGPDFKLAVSSLRKFRELCFAPALLVHPTTRELSSNAYVELICTTVVCRARSVLTRQLDVRNAQHTRAALVLLLGVKLPTTDAVSASQLEENQELSFLLPDFVREHLLETCVVPKILHAARGWNAQEDPVPPHAWIFPWLRQSADLGDVPVRLLRQAGVFAAISSKLRVILSGSEWTAADDTVHAVCSPWLSPVFVLAGEGSSSVLDAGDRKHLVGTCILPRLAASFVGQRGTFSSSSRKQRREVKQLVVGLLRWLDSVDPADLVSCLEASGFFRNWHLRLREHLLARPGLKKALRFCDKWRRIFRPALGHARSGRFREHLYHGYFVVDAAVEHLKKRADEGASLADRIAEIPVLPPAPPLHRKVQPSRGGTVPAPDDGWKKDVTFRELVENACARAHAALIRTEHRHESGKPIYRIAGSAHSSFLGQLVILDDVVFVRRATSGPWTPTGLEDLASSLVASNPVT
jgi:GC-rich sequence DNA-binding factor-like protein/G-patch domain